MSAQTKIGSLVELTMSKLIGFILAVATQYFILPLFFHVQIGIIQNMKIAIIFIIVATIKSYCIRRLFNWLHSCDWFIPEN